MKSLNFHGISLRKSSRHSLFDRFSPARFDKFGYQWLLLVDFAEESHVGQFWSGVYSCLRVEGGPSYTYR